MTIKNIIQLRDARKLFAFLTLAFICLALFGNTLHAATKNTTTYYHVNLQGTPIAASDENGAVKWSQSYSSYGYHGENTEQINDKGPTSFGFGAHVEDQYDDKLLVYMQGRYYDPALGRFLSVDPVGFNESNPASFNRYIYGNNNPHKYVDPDGELPLLLIYWGVSAALSAYDTYSAYQEGGIGAAAVQIALSTGGAGGKLALRGGKLLAGLAKADRGGGKADFIVDCHGTAVRNSASGARRDLEAGGFPGKATSETLESGTIHRNVPGKDGPMDVRIMDGQVSGGQFKGPRIRTTRSGSTNDGVRSDGSRFRNNESKR